MDRPNSSVSSKAKDSFSQFLETNFVSKNTVHISKGNSIPWIKGKIWIVLKGFIKLRVPRVDGDELILGFLGPNQVFGEPFSLIDDCSPFALINSELLYIPVQEAYNSPPLAIAIMESLSLRNRHSELNVAVLVNKNVEEKVKAFLELMATDFGTPVAEGLKIDFRMTHQDIANAIGSTRVSITRILSKLRETGWLIKTDGFLIITGP